MAAVGIGVPGLIASNGLIHSSVNMQPLEGLNLAEFIQARSALPTVCGNDANLIAVGEQRFGAGARGGFLPGGDHRYRAGQRG